MSESHLNNTSKERLIVKYLKRNRKNQSVYYSLSTKEDSDMSSDQAPLITSQDNNFDEDDYLSEGSQKTYGMYSGTGNTKNQKIVVVKNAGYVVVVVLNISALGKSNYFVFKNVGQEFNLITIMKLQES